MWSKIAFAAVAGLISYVSYVPVALAQVDCGPHSRLGSTEPKPGGGVYYHCVCDRGYVPSSTAVVSGPRGTLLRPPRCVPSGGLRRTQSAAPKPTKRSGSYTAEPAREPQRETAPARESRPPQRELGKTTAQQPESVAAAPRPDVPVPRPTAVWADKFPPPSAPAAVKLTPTSFQHIREVPLPSPQWVREKIKEKAEEEAFSFAYGKLPLGEAINRAREIRDNIAALGKRQVEDVKQYAVQIFALQSRSISCLGSGTVSPQCEQALQEEEILKKFGAKETEFKDNWLKQEFGKAIDILKGGEE